MTNCQFIGPAQLSGFEGIDVEGGTLNVSQSQVTGWNTGILVRTGTATITHSTIAGNGMGIDNIGADSAVTAQYDDLANNTFAGIYNGGAPQIAATYNWWGSSGGPASPGGSPARGNINFSPWLGDSQSLNLTTPDSLGFNSTGSDSYTVTPIASGPILQVSLANASWSVTPAGTVVFTGNGGGVTISGESKTNAFTLTNAAVTFAAGDVFNGATIQFNGSIGREIDAKGRINSFDVSGFTGAATLTAPSRRHGEHGAGHQECRLHADQHVALFHRRHEPYPEGNDHRELDREHLERQTHRHRRREALFRESRT